MSQNFKKLYEAESTLIDTFFAQHRPKPLPYSIKRWINGPSKGKRKSQLNPKYMCYYIDIPLGASISELKRAQNDLAVVIYNNRSRFGFKDEVRVLVNEQPPMLIVARVDPKALEYSTRPRNIKPRMVLIGKSFVGGESNPEVADLNSPDGCHILVSGRTGSGKTRMTKGIILTGCEASEPEELQVAIIDIGGKAMGEFSQLPHCCAYVTEIDESLALLKYFEAKMVGKQDTYKTRYMIVIDEEPALVSTGDKLIDDEFTRLMKVIGERGRAYGISLVLGAQNPTNQNLPVVVRRNIPVRIAGMCPEDEMSQIILGKGDTDAAQLTLAGTFIVKTNNKKRMVFSYFLTEDEILSEIARLQHEYDRCEQIELIIESVDSDVKLPQAAIDAAVEVLRRFDDGNGNLKAGYIVETKLAIANALGRKAITGRATEIFSKYLEYVVACYRSENI